MMHKNRLSEAHKTAILQMVLDCIISIDHEGRIIEFNSAAERTFGYRREDVLGREMTEVIIPPSLRDHHRRGLAHYLTTQAGPLLDRRIEIPAMRADGTAFPIELTVIHLPMDGHPTFTVLLRDITKRKQAEQALRASEERYRAIVEGQSEMVCRFRPDGTILFVNGAYARARNTTPEALTEANFWDFIEPEDRPAVRALLNQLRPDAPKIRIENRFETAEGVRWTLWTNHGLAFDADGRATEVQSAGIDITDRKNAEEALRQLNETLEQRVEERTRQVRQLASRLTMAEQEERRRISQILHDDLQQLLYGIDLKMSMIHQNLQKAKHPELTNDLSKARAWVGQAIATIRQLTVDLSPPILKTEGLADMIAWLRTQMQDLHGLEITVEAAHPFSIADEDLRVLLFQIVRELLFNVKKHAGVDRAVVDLKDEAGHLVIHVIDEGQGFDVAEVAAREEHAAGFGLYSARERLRLLGGRLEVRSRPGEGTHIEVHAPARGEA